MNRNNKMVIKVYKYFLIGICAIMMMVALYLTAQLDFLSTYGRGSQTDGFGNAINVVNGRAYWTIPYLLERILQSVLFFGAIGLGGYALNLNDKDNHIDG